MAMAFVLEHPGVTSAIIGPRIMEHLGSQFGAADIRLDPAVLDRIDEIVPPGTNVNGSDGGFVESGLADPRSRRRRRD